MKELIFLNENYEIVSKDSKGAVPYVQADCAEDIDVVDTLDMYEEGIGREDSMRAPCNTCKFRYEAVADYPCSVCKFC